MNKDVLETLVIVGGILWLIYKYLKIKKERSLFTAIFLICSLPWRWPFFLPIQVTFSLWSFAGAIALFLEHRKKHKEYGLAYFYILVFMGLGLIFLSQAVLG